MVNTILRLTTAGGLRGHRRRGDVHLARVRPLGRRDASLPAARGHRPEPRSSARRSGTGCARSTRRWCRRRVADRHRALGHGRQARRLPLYQLLGGARDGPVLRQHAAPRRRRGLYRLCAARLDGGLQGGQVPLLVRARRAICRWARRCTAPWPTRASRSCSTSSSATRAIGAGLRGRRLEPLGFAWFEAPLLDTDLEGYRELRRHTACRSSRPATLARPAGHRARSRHRLLERCPGRRHDLRRHHADPQDHGAGRGAQQTSRCSAGAIR